MRPISRSVPLAFILLCGYALLSNAEDHSIAVHVSGGGIRAMTGGLIGLREFWRQFHDTLPNTQKQAAPTQTTTLNPTAAPGASTTATKLKWKHVFGLSGGSWAVALIDNHWNVESFDELLSVIQSMGSIGKMDHFDSREWSYKSWVEDVSLLIASIYAKWFEPAKPLAHILDKKVLVAAESEKQLNDLLNNWASMSKVDKETLMAEKVKAGLKREDVLLEHDKQVEDLRANIDHLVLQYRLAEVDLNAKLHNITFGQIPKPTDYPQVHVQVDLFKHNAKKTPRSITGFHQPIQCFSEHMKQIVSVHPKFPEVTQKDAETWKKDFDKLEMSDELKAEIAQLGTRLAPASRAYQLSRSLKRLSADQDSKLLCYLNPLLEPELKPDTHWHLPFKHMYYHRETADHTDRKLYQVTDTDAIAFSSSAFQTVGVFPWNNPAIRILDPNKDMQPSVNADKYWFIPKDREARLTDAPAAMKTVMQRADISLTDMRLVDPGGFCNLPVGGFKGFPSKFHVALDMSEEGSGEKEQDRCFKRVLAESFALYLWPIAADEAEETRVLSELAKFDVTIYKQNTASSPSFIIWVPYLRYDDTTARAKFPTMSGGLDAAKPKPLDVTQFFGPVTKHSKDLMPLVRKFIDLHAK